MSEKSFINVPLNRVEGDLEIRAEIEDGVVRDAWCSGTMFRGFERILQGRAALDGLLLTPRICGICGTSHQAAAAAALNRIAGITPPPDARRVIDLVLMCEHIQSDMRHGFLMFTADFVNPAYKDNPLYEEALRRYAPLKGETVIEVIRETKKVLEINAILSGQWPHSSFIVPGGIVSRPNDTELLKCRMILKHYRKWYENRILGCSIERFGEIRSAGKFDAWLDEKQARRESDLGFYVRYSRKTGLDKIGSGCTNFLSFGSTEPPGCSGTDSRLFPAGFLHQGIIFDFAQENISEHVATSWFLDYTGGKHPFEGETRPFASGYEGKKYSWAKAPRYKDLPAETGPLADMLVSGNSLIADMAAVEGHSAFLRELARLLRPAILIPAMEQCLSEIRSNAEFYISPGEISEGEGFGLAGAARGGLGHWVKIREGKIAHYQIITPTAWNLSPRDSNDVRGPAEEALMGTEVRDPANPVELGHVIRSFDACLVCTVHVVDGVQ